MGPEVLVVGQSGQHGVLMTALLVGRSLASDHMHAVTTAAT